MRWASRGPSVRRSPPAGRRVGSPDGSAQLQGGTIAAVPLHTGERGGVVPDHVRGSEDKGRRWVCFERPAIRGR